MPNKIRKKWQRPFNWPPNTWEFTPGLQKTSEFALALLFLLIVLTIISAAVLWPVLIYRTFQHVFNGNSEDVRNSLLAVAALIGVPFLIWRTLIASKQTNISREGHYTALFTKAVEQLGADKVVKKREFKAEYERFDDGRIKKDPLGKPIPKLSDAGEPLGEYVSYEMTTTNYEVRLGAIYALERIAQDSTRDALPIYLTLCSYIDNNAEKFREGAPQNNVFERNNSDVVEIFNVLDRYRGPKDEKVITDFDSIRLPAIRLFSGGLSGTRFSRCFIEEFSVHLFASDIAFYDCRSPRFEISKAHSVRFVVREGKFDVIQFHDGGCRDFDIQTRADKAFLLASDFEDGVLKIECRKVMISDANFGSVTFLGTDEFAIGSIQILKSTFRNCIFIEVNFAFCDFSESEFISCQFFCCNFVRAANPPLNSHEVVDCFTDEDYVPGKASPEYPDLDLKFQWENWRRSHGNR